jgi:cold-inducible RNA-binding protein
MASKLYVGRLPYTTTDDDLQTMFAAFGTVVSAKVIMDRDSGRSKGFGFVEMESDEDAKKAIEALNDSEQGKMRIVVNEARPQEERPRRDFGGGGNRY